MGERLASGRCNLLPNVVDERTAGWLLFAGCWPKAEKQFSYRAVGKWSFGSVSWRGSHRAAARKVRSIRLLLVEDSRDLATWLAKVLRNDGYAVDAAHDGEEADDLLRLVPYDLVVLDLALPRMSGLEVLRGLRARGSVVPVILLTANASLNGRVRGLDEGADDYLVKPFEVAELEARIRAQLRRAGGRPAPLQHCGDLVFDTTSRDFTLAGVPLALTPREQAVLEALVRRPGRTLSKAVLAEAVFGFDDRADPSAIEIYVHRLRKKLEGSAVTIATLRGMGYLLRHDAP